MSSNKFFGNQTILNFVKRALSGNTLSPSLLVTGEKGLGKKTFARFLAKALNCEKESFFESCACVPCAKIDASRHPDVRWYGVDEESKSVKIAEVKDLIRWISLKPFEARVKVFIVNDADTMTFESQNALLKTLEEPPPQSQLILLTAHRHLLLETIVSRAVEIKLRPLAVKELSVILRDEYEMGEEGRFLAQISGGNLGHALQLAGEGYLEENRKLIDEWIRLGSWDFLSAHGVKTREETRERLDLFIHFIRDLLIYKLTSKKELLFFPHECDRIQRMSENRSVDDILRLANELLGLEMVMEENVNQKIASGVLATKLEEGLL